MSNKYSLYTKYRPQTFNEVVGQSVAKDILINSIDKNKINHAYLFYGIRGTGKTTLARIFAKAINCENTTNSNPCNECQMCKSINEGSAFDIIEIDAASNNGVDEIRQIKENTTFLTASANYRVYIIDEVHMLTKAAFNALLKTLEEPPKNTVFLLATTELNKIPETVLSRSVIINLEVMTEEHIKEGLEYILNKEGIEYESEALYYLTLVAGGSLRDAISALETSLLYNENLSVENIISALGLIKKSDIKYLLEENPVKLAELLDSSDKNITKTAILIMETTMELLKENKYNYAIFLKKMVKLLNTTNDPLLLKIGVKSILYDQIVPRETLVKNEASKQVGVSRETIKENQSVENTDKQELSQESTDIEDNSGKLSIDKTLEISVENRLSIMENKDNNKEVSHKEKEIKEPTDNVENNEDIITNYANSGTYLYIMKNNNETYLLKAKNKWKYIENMLAIDEYKDLARLLVKTTPLASSEKTLILGFENGQQLNEFKEISLKMELFCLIKEVIGIHMFILPVSRENWSKLKMVQDNTTLTPENTDLALNLENYVKNEQKMAKESLNELFGEANITHE